MCCGLQRCEEVRRLAGFNFFNLPFFFNTATSFTVWTYKQYKKNVLEGREALHDSSVFFPSLRWHSFYPPYIKSDHPIEAKNTRGFSDKTFSGKSGTGFVKYAEILVGVFF